MGANTRLDSLSDLIKHKANVKLICPCGRVHIFDAERLNRYALLRSWNTQLEALRYRVRCTECQGRGVRLKATPEPPTLADPFPRTEVEWKRLHRRLRG
ncbi:hypothetical protein SAMN05192583_2930 [Sphingomonas gellani]|uniref:Uncharacterized protein n=1 Tax=Sphingomonas gellani TaxID=1166340 RepID=A0A1H8H412_9SPHN|nr:hypothetical protein [Sphingomonas gellani]SEN51131.1 hypothetical protein SAMN05192583_2930 [Sphingomonas gellani]